MLNKSAFVSLNQPHNNIHLEGICFQDTRPVNKSPCKRVIFLDLQIIHFGYLNK